MSDDLEDLERTLLVGDFGIDDRKRKSTKLSRAWARYKALHKRTSGRASLSTMQANSGKARHIPITLAGKSS